jgi:glycerol-3-phosphate dehydrogenase
MFRRLRRRNAASSRAPVSAPLTSNEPKPRSTMRADVEALRTTPYADVLVIGGGINGLAAFRYLALQGVDVALVERNDYGSGASAASSHMIHGGIRYLENGEFRLVRESVQERNALLTIAPHYVKPLRTTIPIFSTFSGILGAPLRFLLHRAGKPEERGALLIKVGLVLYDSYSRATSTAHGRLPFHDFRGRRRSLRELPLLDPDLKYTATYYDASVHDPERLALDVLLDGRRSSPIARSANYTEAIGTDSDGVLLRDAETGEEFTFRARVVVNASGPWTDLTNAALGHPSQYMGGTKGSHIVLDSPELLAACDGREIFFENEDGRIVLIYPLKGKVLVGTTDLEADPTQPVVCTEEEVDYFFDLVRRVFPTVELSRSQIVFRFSGIRPLPRHGDLHPGFVSRDYRIDESRLPGRSGATLFSLIGGKWTTFRALGDQLGSRVLESLGRRETMSTVGRAIGGGADYPMSSGRVRAWAAAHARGVGEERAGELLARYGTRATEVLSAIHDAAASEAPDRPLTNAPHLSTAEIGFLARREHVVHLTDLVLRRTSLAFTGSVTSGLLTELADLAGDALGWDADRRSAEVEQTVEVLRARHGVEVAASPVAAAH